MTADADCLVSVVMPCLNEARTVGRCIDKALAALRDLAVSGEVLIADNGSTDGSPDIAHAHGARVIHVERKGYGSALKGGIDAARGIFIVMGDADDSYDFAEIGPLLERLRLGDDLVLGNRFLGGIRPGAMPWLHRHVGNPILTGILNLFFHAGIGDAHCGLRAFRKDSSLRLRLRTTGMEFASEMVVRAALAGQHISEVPVSLHPDGRDRPPHLRSFRDGWRHLRLLLLLCPRWLFGIPALTLLLLGALGVFVDLRQTTESSPSPWLLPAAACLVCGIQTLWCHRFACVLAHPTRHGPDTTPGLLQGIASGLAGSLLLSVSMLCETPGLSRGIIWGSVLILVGVQCIFSAFILAMLRMQRAGETPRA